MTEAVSRLRMGDQVEDRFFSKRYDTEMKMAIASELLMEHIAQGDIARLLGVTRRGLEYMLARLRQRNADMLPLTWNRDRLVETVDALEDAGYMSMSLAEGDPDPRNKALFLSNAIRAYGDAGNLRLRLGVSKEIADALRAGMKGENAPDPNDRIDYIDWVYRNKIAPKLEADAEIVALPSESAGESSVPGEMGEEDVSEKREGNPATDDLPGVRDSAGSVSTDS